MARASSTLQYKEGMNTFVWRRDGQRRRRPRPQVGGFFDEQTVGGQRQGRLKCSYYLGPERERAGEEGEVEEEEQEVGVEAVKPEMEKARMADDDGRRAAEGGREERKEGRADDHF